jgi:1-acyl-sn-glycerol-3-phosphate acyltransferase
LSDSRLAAAELRALDTQRRIGWLVAPLWIPLCIALMKFGLRWRIEGMDEARRVFARVRSESQSPILVCGNHLTMLDSFLISWALSGPTGYLRDYASLAWNTPERENFASTWWKRVLVYLMKCVPVERGGDRQAVGMVLKKLIYLMGRGEVAMVFPEGGRSRLSRVDTDAVTYGVGRIVKALPGCRVVCVYLRGDSQQSWSGAPKRGERFRVQADYFEPKSDQKGMRGSVDITRQVLTRLAEMEQRHFDGR